MLLASVRGLFRPAYLAIAALIAFCLLIGAAMPIYVGLMDGQPSRLVAFPAALIFTLLLLYDRKMTLLLIILTRASGDFFLSLTKFSLAGMQVGVGGLINAIVILIAILLVFEKPQEVPRKTYLMWAPFLLIALYGVVISPDKSGAIRSWLGQLSSFAVFIGAFHFVRSKEDFHFCLRVILYSAILPLLMGFFDVATHRVSAAGVDEGEGLRVASTFGHPNEFAFYLSMVVGLAFYKLKTLGKENRFRNSIFLTTYLLILLVMLVLTKTRSAWFATLLGFVLYAIFFERSYLIYIFGLGVVAMLIPGVADRLADLGHGNEVVTYARLNSFAWRVYLWQSGLNWMSIEHYPLGYGFTAFQFYSPTFFPIAGKTNWDAHSAYVQLLFELGGIGFMAYIWLYYKVLRQMVSMLRFDKLGAFTVIIVIVNYLICSASDNMFDYLAVNWYLWFTVGIACAYVRANPQPVVRRVPKFAPPGASLGAIYPVSGTARAPSASLKGNGRE
jgi:O-antigen ligase